MLSQVSSFAVSPNYEILFFASDVFEVVNILDFLGEKRKTLEDVLADLDNFNYGGEQRLTLHVFTSSSLPKLYTQPVIHKLDK